MEIKKNKKRLNVLKLKTKLKTLIYFFLEIKLSDTETLLKSVLKYSKIMPINLSELKFPLSIKNFEKSLDLFQSLSKNKKESKIVFISFKNIFFKTVKEVEFLYIFNNFNNLKNLLHRNKLLLKLLKLKRI